MHPYRTLALVAGLALALAAHAERSPSQILHAQAWASPALGRDLDAEIYLPPGYDPKGPALPVIYLLHGVDAAARDWIDQGHLQATADRLIADGKLAPVIVVMPDASNSWYMNSGAGGHGAMATAIGRDLPDWIEAHYRAGHGRAARAIAGYSMGGFGALAIAMRAPDRWAAAGALSGAFWEDMPADHAVTPETDAHLQRIFEGSFGRPFDPKRLAEAQPWRIAATLPPGAAKPALYFVCGANDRFNLARSQATVANAFTRLGFTVETHLIPGDHDWDTWSAALPDLLVFLGRRLTARGGH